LYTMPAFELPDRYKHLQERARALAVSVEPYAASADASGVVHARVLEALADSHLCELAVPASYGGTNRTVDPLAICVVREVLMPASSHLDSLFAMQGIGSYALGRAGRSELRSAWLPRVAACEALAAFAVTEPEAGSDIRSITTTVTQSSDGLRLTGSKSFISNAPSAAFFTVLAREGESFSLFLVERDSDGVKVTMSPELTAPHVLGEILFENVRLSENARIGRPGDGFSLTLATLATFRASVGAAAVGLAQAAFDEALTHAVDRHQFGRPLAEIGAVAAMIAESWAEIEMTRLVTYRAAEHARRDPLASLHETSMAKLAATEAAGRVIDRSLQMMGRFGLVRGTKIDRLWRNARPMRIYEGSSEVLRASIAASLVKAHAR
jgi:acyl-CoA dehydrogenase